MLRFYIATLHSESPEKSPFLPQIAVWGRWNPLLRRTKPPWFRSLEWLKYRISTLTTVCMHFWLIW